MSSSFKELLRQAEMAQKERDEATQQLKIKKKKDEEARRRALVEQVKRAKSAVPVRKGPLSCGDTGLRSPVSKKPIVNNAVRLFRPSPTASDTRRPTKTLSTANRPALKPRTLTAPKPRPNNQNSKQTAMQLSSKSCTAKPPKQRSNLANPKQAVGAKTPTTVKPRPTQPSLSFAEMMKLAQNNVAQGISPLDRPKPPEPIPLPSNTPSSNLKSVQNDSNQKRKRPQMSFNVPSTSRSVATADAAHSMPIKFNATQNLQPMKSSEPHIQQRTETKPQLWSAPKRLRRYSEDEADSMDDFIDDDEEDLEAQRELKSVVQKLCRSDQSTWKKRECEIDITRMENSYRCVELEEKRTARIALIEDKMEQGRGAQIL